MDFEYRIRRLLPADLEHLWSMQWDPLPRELSSFYLLCTIGHPRFCLVAEATDGRAIGVLLATPQERGEWIYLNHMRVEAECRGYGVGSELVKRLEAECRIEGIERVWLLTSVDVEPFYAAAGYRRDNSFLPSVTRQLMTARRPEALVLSKRL